MHVNVDDINFCDGIECLYVKYKAMHQQHVNCLINSCFFFKKTWLLMACDTAFYAIIANRVNHDQAALTRAA